MEPTRLRDARTHNLKGIDLDLVPGELVVIAGVSGSGKSSLALDTLYAEGQRRFVESFSPYARQFLERRDRPPVGSLDPVPAAIAVDRGTPVRTSRSTVGTMTELQDYLRVLWSRAATVVCDGCSREVRRGTVKAAVDAVLSRVHGRAGVRTVVTYSVTVGDPERYLGVRESLLEAGYRRVLLDERMVDLDELPPSVAVAQGELHVIVDRLVVRETERSRLAEAIGTALMRGGRAEVHLLSDDGVDELLRFARGLECANCGRSYPEPSPSMFSFHSPLGACAECRGFGRVIGIDWDKVVPDPSLSIGQGAIKPWSGRGTAWERRELAKFCKARRISTTVSWSSLTEEARRAILYGTDGFFGVKGWFDWLETKTYKMHVRVFLSRYRRYDPCPACGGSRLRPEINRYRVAGLSLTDAGRLPVALLRSRLAQLPSMDEPTDRLVQEIRSRLGYLEAVGLGYLSLDRPSRTLSGGEVQRVALTAALGTSLTGTLMVLDEPTVGLHPRDAARLVEVARELAALGNVVTVVEHDLTVIASADRVIELGPGAGEHGGKIVYDGPPSGLASGLADTPTARAMRSRAPICRRRRQATSWLILRGARGHNLKNVTVRFPLGVFTCVTGVSGSGKSTLVSDTLYPAVMRALGRALDTPPLPFDALEGVDTLRDVVLVDQAPLGRTSRGNAATYIGVYDTIREMFASLPESRVRGYTPGTFSFNVDGGRCPSCNGEGFETVEMQFLADVTFQCPDCHGRRFRDEVLEVRWRGLSIADVLALSVSEAVKRFDDVGSLVKPLKVLIDVGLGYLSLGQPLSMLSGGEAQRLKLARSLVDAVQGTLVILDEPTAGLHRADVDCVLAAIDALVDRGVTVIAVEHDPYVAAHSDHVIDLGPEAADAGGEVVAQGTPESVAETAASRFAPFLREALNGTVPVPVRCASRRDSAGADPATEHAIVVEGAHEHNLQISRVEIPREKLVVVTGLSGSGKSSLVFDVVYAEGQRRFLETLSPYARQYLPSLGRADVDRIAGIPPAICLEQRTARAGAMSTVATITEVAHYLRLLFAKVGVPYCPECDLPIVSRTPESVVDDLLRAMPARARLQVWAPVVRGRKGQHKEVFEAARRAGVQKVRVDGHPYDPRNVPPLKSTTEHNVAFFLGIAKASQREDVLALVRRAMQLADGHAVLEGQGEWRGQPVVISTRRACPRCARGVPELDPRHFSFNTRHGRCEVCEGAGIGFDGTVCDACKGARLGPVPRAVRLGEKRFHEWLACTPSDVRAALKHLTFGPREERVARAISVELDARLRTLEDLRLDYLTLDRRADTLSGGEMQRLRLAAQIGAGLTGVLYVLDEPTIGLHARDTGRLVQAMRRLVQRGASVLVVEHDADVIRAADHVIDLGPGGGRGGGKIVAQGPAQQVLTDPVSPTARSLRRSLGAAARRRPVDGHTPSIVVKGACAHNLANIDVRFPLGRLVCVAGVSGSGKSTLVKGILYPALRRELGLQGSEPLPHDEITGADQIRTVKLVDQSPIGRTPRSVPATYVGIWDEIRRMLAATPEARARGWGAGRFSFNVSVDKGGGRCEACEGAGVKLVEMAFLPDVVVPCEVCSGLRFGRETREVTLHGYDAGEILRLTVDEARQVFSQVSSVARPLDLLADLGLGYLTLGQGSHTLSGGEAQRIKLATELQGRGGKTLYVLDEPTTGLHLTDVERLVEVLQKLVDRGDSVIVVEHHPWVLAAADWIIELGPGGGRHGGRVVAEGPPDAIARARTATGEVLRQGLKECASVVASSSN